MSMKMVLSILDSGRMTKDMELVSKSGQMEPSMKVNGNMARLTVKVCLTISMVTSTKDSGREIKPMERASILMPMAQPMKDSGKMISNMDTVWKSGVIRVDLRESTTRGKSTASEPTLGLMDLLTSETGNPTLSTAKVATNGLMVDNMTEIG